MNASSLKPYLTPALLFGMCLALGYYLFSSPPDDQAASYDPTVQVEAVAPPATAAPANLAATGTPAAELPADKPADKAPAPPAEQPPAKPTVAAHSAPPAPKDHEAPSGLEIKAPQPAKVAPRRPAPKRVRKPTPPRVGPSSIAQDEPRQHIEHGPAVDPNAPILPPAHPGGGPLLVHTDGQGPGFDSVPTAQRRGWRGRHKAIDADLNDILGD